MNESMQYINISRQNIRFDKLFPRFNEYICFKNLKIDNESIHYITTPLEAKKICGIILKHLTKFKPIDQSTIVDGTGGVGGDTIMFCSMFERVISIELLKERYEMLKHNINQYKFTNATIMNGNSTDIIPNLGSIDVIYIDPPWGGSSYKEKELLRLNLGNFPIEQFVKNCFNLITSPKIIVIKLPKNYDLEYLFNCLNDMCDIYLYELNKMNILAIEKKQSEKQQEITMQIQEPIDQKQELS